MGVVVPARAIERVAASQDPRAAIMELVGPALPDITVMSNMVLIATYIRPEKTSGGIIRPQTNVQEDVWQGKVGLVLKLGPLAFKDSDGFSFCGEVVENGEWVVFKVGDAWSLTIRDYPCRLVRDSAIRLKVSAPETIF